MNQLSEEQQPTVRTGGEDLSIFEIMQRYRNDGSCEYVIQDALRRLSLLDSDSQAAEISTSAHELAVEWSQSTSDNGISVDDINRLAQLIDQRATLMRDKCVDAIKSLRATPHGAAYNNAINDAIHKVESLTQVRPGEG